MKGRFYTILVIAIILAFVLGYTQKRAKNSPGEQRTAIAKPNTSSTAGKKASQAQTQLVGNARPSVLTVVGNETSPEKYTEYIEQANLPVNFFGKVVDQQGNPVLVRW
jgi:hypothetical protein